MLALWRCRLVSGLDNEEVSSACLCAVALLLFEGEVSLQDGKLSEMDAEFRGSRLRLMNLSGMADLFRAGANPEAVTPDAVFPLLHIAACHDSADMVALLFLVHRANIEVTVGKRGQAPLLFISR